MKKLIMIDALSVHRMRYVVETDGTIDQTIDSFGKGLLEGHVEMSQKWLGETLPSAKEITEEEYFKMFDEDNDYLKEWTPEQKKTFIHKL